MRLELALVALLSLALAGGCVTRSRWSARHDPNALDAAAVLASDTGAYHRDLRPEEVPAIPIRERVRPCCAFGSKLQVRVGALKIPGYQIENIRAAEDIGNHNYDAGQIGESVSEGEENNGLVYTCRGGFIDTAHVRDYADWTLFLASFVGRNLESGGVVTLPDEGGPRRFVLESVDPVLVRDVGRPALSSALGVWAAFQLSIWHEIATWYGWSAFAAFPERASAFSPEDLYSNLLGAKLVVPIIDGRLHATEALFDGAVDVWLRQALVFLGAVDASLGEAAMHSVDQLWWNSSAVLPDDDLVLRRNLQIGASITPWQVPDEPWSQPVLEELGQQCGGDLQPHVMHNPSRIPGLPFADVLRFEVDLGPRMIGQPAFEGMGTTIDQSQFPEIVERIRKEVRETFGPLGAGPHAESH